MLFIAKVGTEKKRKVILVYDMCQPFEVLKKVVLKIEKKTKDNFNYIYFNFNIISN